MFGNDAEFRAFAIAEKWFDDDQLSEPLSNEDAREISRKCSTLLRPRSSQEDLFDNDRLVVITRGEKATVVFSAALDKARLFDVARLPTDELIDTTGAGDAFVGGVLCALAQDFDLDQSIELGHKAAFKIIQTQGCDVSVI